MVGQVVYPCKPLVSFMTPWTRTNVSVVNRLGSGCYLSSIMRSI